MCSREFDPKLSADSRAGRDALPRQHPARAPARASAPACEGAKFAALDSMNFWIETEREALVRGDRGRRLPAAERRRDPRVHRRAEPVPRGARRDGAGPRVVVAKRGEYGAALFTATTPSRSRASCSRTSATRPAPATASRAGSSAISTAAARPASRPSTTRVCARRWPTARCSPRSTSRTSAPSGSQSLSREQIDGRLRELRQSTLFEVEQAPSS